MSFASPAGRDLVHNLTTPWRLMTGDNPPEHNLYIGWVGLAVLSVVRDGLEPANLPAARDHLRRSLADVYPAGKSPAGLPLPPHARGPDPTCHVGSLRSGAGRCASESINCSPGRADGRDTASRSHRWFAWSRSTWHSTCPAPTWAAEWWSPVSIQSPRRWVRSAWRRPSW